MHGGAGDSLNRVYYNDGYLDREGIIVYPPGHLFTPLEVTEGRQIRLRTTGVPQLTI